MSEENYSKVIRCPSCYKVSYDWEHQWRYVGKTNSTKFCCICDSAVDEVCLTDKEIENYKELHITALKNNLGD